MVGICVCTLSLVFRSCFSLSLSLLSLRIFILSHPTFAPTRHRRCGRHTSRKETSRHSLLIPRESTYLCPLRPYFSTSSRSACDLLSVSPTLQPSKIRPDTFTTPYPSTTLPYPQLHLASPIPITS